MHRLQLHFKSEIYDLEELKQGFTNKVYKFRVKNNWYIYKEYSQTNENEISVLTKISIPSIVYNHPSYRIEEYLENKELDYIEDMKDIILAMKEMHALDSENVMTFESLVECLYQDAITNIKCKAVGEEKVCLKNLNNAEEYVRQTLGILRDNALKLYKENEYKEGLCHNDLQPNNMLKTQNKVVIIDYEFATKGDVLFDIANLFCETHIDYKNKTCVYKAELGYKEEHEIDFLKTYFEGQEVNIEDIRMRINNFKLISHFIWFLWAIPKLTEHTNEEFKYDNYAKDRLHALIESGFVCLEEAYMFNNILFK
ncbi:putative choline kinase 2 [Nosema granulosis]|uniref:ethanolamine kinase n=1 Tax=Nosema granulosis TaxID=83296 RepID=A0A9P6KZE8_9MICR|nr:putative choline kinase 2 [Nosema granulosis]